MTDRDLPSDEKRTEAYNAELISRYLTGQFLTAADKCEAKSLIASQKCEPRSRS